MIGLTRAGVRVFLVHACFTRLDLIQPSQPPSHFYHRWETLFLETNQISGHLAVESFIYYYRTDVRNTENLPYLCPSDTLWVSSIIPERSHGGALATTLRSDCAALPIQSGAVEEL
jgi:hypothetical protein